MSNKNANDKNAGNQTLAQEQMIAAIAVKALTKQPLTSIEKQFLVNNAALFTALSSAARTEKANNSETEKIEALTKYRADMEKFFVGYFAGVEELAGPYMVDGKFVAGESLSETFGADLKSFFRALEIPVYGKGTKGSSDTNWLSARTYDRLEADIKAGKNTYWTAIYMAVKDAGANGISEDDLVTKLEIIFPDRIDTAAGLKYRVHMAVKGKIALNKLENGNIVLVS